MNIMTILYMCCFVSSFDLAVMKLTMINPPPHMSSFTYSNKIATSMFCNTCAHFKTSGL